MLCTSDIYTLINYVGFINYLFYGVTVAGQIVLRVKQPDMYRPIKVKTQTEQIGFDSGYLSSDNTVPHPPGEPGVASDLPLVLGLPAGLFPLLWACGLRYWAGHHDDWCPCVFLWNLLGKQATVFSYYYW